MLFQIAFIVLCLAVMLHLAVHWWELNVKLRTDADMKRLRSVVDWTAAPAKRKRTTRTGLGVFSM